MISRLTGIVLESELTEVVIDVQGVGYEVSIPLSTFEKLPSPGGKVTLYTYLNVREDALQLFGFFTKEERSLFKLLTSAVSGIGPKLALNVLSCISIQDFATAIANGDVKTLSKINGIGKRTAERMILELKEKIALSAPNGTSGINGTPLVTQASQNEQDAIAALETLGFKHDVATRAVQSILEQAKDTLPSTEQLIRKALGMLNS